MRKLILGAGMAALGLGLAAPAFAQGPAVRAPFTGLRVEGLIGLDDVSNQSDDDDDSSTGVGYGAAVGYDLPVGRNLTLGVEGEIADASTKTTVRDIVAAGDRFSVRAGRDLYAGARLGYVISPRTMVYAKGGYTNARFKERYDSATIGYSDHENLEGFRLGAGVEYNIQPNMYVKGEYRYSSYSGIENTDYDVDVDRHQLMAGVGLRF